MSQSDYIQLKKNAQILKEVSKLPYSLSSEEYTTFMTFSLANTISNTVQKNNQISSPIFEIEKNVSSCPSFLFCTNTNTRSNRKSNSQNTLFNGYKLANSYNEYFTYQKYNNLLCSSGEFRKCDEFIYRRGSRIET